MSIPSQIEKNQNQTSSQIHSGGLFPITYKYFVVLLSQRQEKWDALQIDNNMGIDRTEKPILFCQQFCKLGNKHQLLKNNSRTTDQTKQRHDSTISMKGWDTTLFS